jgi:AcrR family transcriptional regulator
MTLPVTTSGLRPLRADAQRNRAKILAAAKTAFAEYGQGTQMDDVARRAEVGVGTLYRHFPTKDDLLRALVTDRFESLTNDARQRAAEIEDPWAALVAIVRHGVEVQSSDLALSQAMSTHAEVCVDARIKAGLDEVTTELLDRARAAGQVRADVTVDDLALLFTGLAKILEAVAGGAPFDPQRYVELMLDGMRA